jgi:anti-sigma28 factor (negative regulator of flagellin synthesis)
MEMNRIESGRMPNQIQASDAKAKKQLKQAGQPPKAGQDQVEFSQKAREIAESLDVKQGRGALVEEARRKLESGELDSPGVYEKTAAKLLKSGELEKGLE